MAYPRDEDRVEVTIPRASQPLRANARQPDDNRGSRRPSATNLQGSYGSPRTRDWYFFLLELRGAMEAGVSFVEALTLCSTNTRNGTIRRAMNSIIHNLRNQKPLETVLGQERDVPPLIRTMLLTGARSGELPRLLGRVVDFFGWMLELRSSVLRAIMYPSAQLILGALVLTGRDVILANLKGVPVPAATLTYSQKYFGPVLIGAGLALLITWLTKTPLLRPVFDRMILTAPLLGKLVKSYCIAAFLRILALLVQAGMPITSAWTMAASTVTNSEVTRRLGAGLHYLQDGESLSTAMKHTGLISKEAKSYAEIGSTSGNIPAMLDKYARFTEERVVNVIRGSMRLLNLMTIPLVVLGYFVHPGFLGALAFFLLFMRRVF